jgi:glycine cleavage system H protein
VSQDGLTPVRGYLIDLGRRYDRERHSWVEALTPEVVRIGLDPLGVETLGDLVELVIQEPGTMLPRGHAFGSVEAAKFVGPLTMPVSGTITARNDAVVADPRRVSADPFGGGWLIEVQLSEATELDDLLAAPKQIRAWFEAEVDAYEAEGVIAE